MSQFAPVPAFRQLRFDDNVKLLSLVGPHDENLTQLEEALDISLIHRGSSIIVTGQNDTRVEVAVQILDEFYANLPKHDEPAHDTFLEILNRRLPTKQGSLLVPEDITLGANLPLPAANIKNDAYHEAHRDTYPSVGYSVQTPKMPIVARNTRQEMYLKAIREATMVFGLGAAGTGKTFLAVGMAVSMLIHGEIERIVLTRPAKEAGEQLGFLPGDIHEKLDPYLRPIHDALEEMLPKHTIQHYLETRKIEIAPLAYMRGRTLRNAVIILDEAQNTTIQQMLMFLTRIGEGSKMVINGDPKQLDLPSNQVSGLVHATRCLSSDEDIRLIYFADSDILRHPLIERIVTAFAQESSND